MIRTSTTLTELTGWETKTTSNRMELLAAIEGLRSLKTPTEVTVITDSAYLLNTMRQKWYEKWFLEERETPRPNLDLWYLLVGLAEFHDITWIKVKGHSGDYWNERADKLADVARREKSALRLEIDCSEEIRCNTVSYGKQCYLYSGHSGDCRWGKHEVALDGV